jgi:hypothetical protein
MTTLASPTLGSAGRSLWRVQMRAGQAGPGLSAIVTADAGARASLADGTDRGVPPWIA